MHLIKDLGVSTYRCSLAWERIQPHKHYYDEAAIKHYHDFFDEAKKQNIKIMATDFHFVIPRWLDEEGGFEREENITYFVDYVRRMFLEFHDKVDFWCTINEPGVYAAQTYLTHYFPRPQKSMLGFPCNLGKGMCLEGVAVVTKNLLKAHIAAYRAIKSLPGGDKAKVGIVHNIIHFEPYHPGNWLENLIARALGHFYCDPITTFLITGNFAMKTYTDATTFTYPQIRDVQDFIGLNYYSHVLIDWMRPWAPQFRPEDHEIATDMYYGLYAEGIYRALMELALLGKPIYITENGLADDKDDRRELWYKRYLYAVSKAIKDGCDVRMFCAWSAFDNFEWNYGYSKKFGLYAFDRTTGQFKLKPGANYFKSVVQNHAKQPH